jgi:hypothetical protein
VGNKYREEPAAALYQGGTPQEDEPAQSAGLSQGQALFCNLSFISDQRPNLLGDKVDPGTGLPMVNVL